MKRPWPEWMVYGSSVRGKWTKIGTIHASSRDGAISTFRRAHTFERGTKFKAVKLASNSSRVKGRKVKNGRAVTLKNFTGTITRLAGGAVHIHGRKTR